MSRVLAIIASVRRPGEAGGGGGGAGDNTGEDDGEDEDLPDGFLEVSDAASSREQVFVWREMTRTRALGSPNRVS